MKTKVRSVSVALACGLALVATTWTTPVQAQGPGYPELDREEELRLAMSAGPLTVSQYADVWLMTDDGFERAVEGSNGWTCIVVRNASQKATVAPHCLNPPATQTVLPAFLREGELQAAGHTQDEISAQMNREWDSGTLPMPEGPAYAYMLSSGQRLGQRNSAFRPHFMLYVPFVTNAAIGGSPQNMNFPFVGPFENHPLATVVIIMDEFVNPEDVDLSTVGNGTR